ncbi:FliH/SctL family protein [Roseovarius sp.]|jgi:flagellar assembly protein FliH
MSMSDLFEDFGPYLHGTPVSLTDISLEEVRLEAFETGYQAGWDDSVAAQKQDSRAVSVQLSQNLQDMSFTYEEARAEVIASLWPLLKQMVETVLPRVAQDRLPDIIAEEIEQMIRDGGDHAVELRAAPADIVALDSLGSDQWPERLKLVEDGGLAGGQVCIRLGEREREIDLNETLRKIDRAVTDFFEDNQKERA